jgi:tRNA A-37 threonylcarbamoyl transferase component Bud32
MTHSQALIGKRIEQFEIRECIARGGMADVYLAYEVELQRKVALKIMLPALASDAQFVARFHREARTVARLDHPNIVQIYTVGMMSAESAAAQRPYIAMQYIEGGSLRDKLHQLAERGKLLTTEQALNIVRQVAWALSAAHKAGIIHRDLKPGNVLVRPDGTPVLAVVNSCLQKEPANRYQHADELIQGIDRALQAEGRQGPNPQVTAVLTHLRDSALISRGKMVQIPTAEQKARRFNPVWIIGGFLALTAAVVLFFIFRPPVNVAEILAETAVPTATQTATSLPATSTPEIAVIVPSPTAVPPTNEPATAVPPTNTPQPTQTPLAPIISADVTAIRLNTAPTIDGNLSDWPQIRPVSSNYLVYQYDGWDGIDDVNALWYLGWDSANLYIAVVVTDDSHVQTQSDVLIYKGDSVDLQFDTDLAGDYGTSLSPDDFQLLLSPGDFRAVPQALFLWQGTSGRNELVASNQIVLNAQATADGYQLEAAIPWQNLSLQPTAGLTIGLALNVSDNDLPGTAVQELLKSNVETRTYLSPATWGTLTLQE